MPQVSIFRNQIQCFAPESLLGHPKFGFAPSRLRRLINTVLQFDIFPCSAYE